MQVKCTTHSFYSNRQGLVLRRMRGVVVGIWEDYGSSCALCKLKPHFKVHLLIQQP